MPSFAMLLLEELQRLFPSIPLVAEEDSASLRSSRADDNSSGILVESIFSAVADKVSNNGSALTQDDVLRAIDRGGKDAVSFDSNPATYWVRSCCFLFIINRDLWSWFIISYIGYLTSSYHKLYALVWRYLIQLMAPKVSWEGMMPCMWYDCLFAILLLVFTYCITVDQWLICFIQPLLQDFFFQLHKYLFATCFDTYKKKSFHRHVHVLGTFNIDINILYSLLLIYS